MSKNILGYVFLLLGGRVLSTFSGFPSSLLKGVLPQRLENRNDSSAFKCHKLAYPDTYRCGSVSIRSSQGAIAIGAQQGLEGPKSTATAQLSPLARTELESCLRER